MNTRTITITIGLLAVTTMLGQRNQISLGVEGFLPQDKFSKEFNAGVGPTLGFELPLGNHLGITVQAAYDFILVKEEMKEVLQSASIVPLQAGLKYYFKENQSGFHAHAQFGAHIFTESFKANEFFGLEAESESHTNFSWGAGVGYQLRKLDIGARYNMILGVEEEESDGKKEEETFSYIALRVAYLINLGK